MLIKRSCTRSCTMKRKVLTGILISIFLLWVLIIYQLYNRITTDTIIFTFSISGILISIFLWGVQVDDNTKKD